MTAEAMAGTQLLKMNEEDFQKAIKEMAIKDLMETISGLQKEMAREQENFNSLSSELQNLKDRNSRQYKQISKDMVISQQHLTQLMNKSMKCFAQQNLHNSSDSTLKRRNSAKGSKPLATPAAVSTNLQRSKSLLTVNQAAIADLSSSFQSTQIPLLANSSSSAQHSTHVPVIMRTTANGGVKKSHEINFPERKSVNSGKEMERPLVSTSTESQAVTGHTGILNGPDSTKVGLTGDESDNQLNSGSASGATGLYVKRKPNQQPRVVTTTNISSSKFLPPSKPLSSPPVTESATPMLFSTSAASSTNAPSSRPLIITTLSSSANDSRSIKPMPVASQPEYVSPLQMAQARKGVSKSQTFLQDNDSLGFRGLPSVKLLAQSFGSNTALNTIPGSGSGSSSSSYVSKFHTANKVVYRSNSSLNLTNSQSSTFAPQFVPKSTTGGGSAQTTQQEPAVFINGKTQPTVTKQLNRAPQSSPPSSNEPNEFERTRSRLKSVGREVTTETTNGNVHSSVVTPIASNRVKTPDENPDGECNDERVGEGNRIGAYVKRKDTVPSKPMSGIQTTPLASVTVKPINSSSSTRNTAPASTPSLNKPSSQKVSATLSSHNPSVDNSKSTFNPPALKTPQSTALTNTHTLPANFAQKRQTPASSAANPTSRSNSSTAPSPHREFGARGSVVSTAAVTIRRAKSREELQQIESDSRTNKDLVLQQIQARRRDHDGDGSNFRAMSNLSRSMPSLLSEDFPKGGDGSKTSPIKSSIVLQEEKLTADNGVFVDDGIEMEDEEKVSRMNLRDWDPNLLLSELYKVKLADEVVEDISHQFITMEGLMEKLPMNKRKATLLKTWKRRFFKAKDGWLYYYETSSRDQPSESIQLMGGVIHDIGTRVLGIDDGRGRFLMVRCPTEKEYGQWKVALESQTADNTKATYVRPVLRSPRHSTKNVVIIDLGSSAIRAGILGQQVSLPELFFPSLVAVDKDSGKVVAAGQDALRPNFRHRCKIVQPIRPSNKVDQTRITPFNIEVHLMRAIFEKIFDDLNVSPADYWVMISTPQNLGDQLKTGLMEILVTALKVKGVCMVQQALLALYSYNATSGIIVDIGHRIEILPIFDGFVIEGGVARCPYGGQKVEESLTTSLLSNNYKFVSTTEQLLVRYVMEKSCYVAMDYGLEVEWCKSQPQTTRRNVKFNSFDLPAGAYTSVECDLGRFKSPEGFFNVDLWEMDYPTLQKLVYQAIQTCPMDNRRHVWRAVFLSGGITLLPGFAERLEKELGKLAPQGVPVEVHAAPQRYHAAFIGACSVALMPQFEGMAISREEWRKDAFKAFRKWQAPSS